MDIVQSVSGGYTPYAYEDITIDATAGGVGLTASNIKPTASALNRDLGKARLVLLTVDGADVRFTLDGTAPVGTTGPGHLMHDGDGISIMSYKIMTDIRFIRDGATSAKARVTYLR